ncbi:Imm53 family immunity protein [Paenibacillus amylolyticus]|uniref:Imm53 family immunity protein n=1 Tax=Paenibacillus TaxID=44249 RepID=UPI003BB1E17A
MTDTYLEEVLFETIEEDWFYYIVRVDVFHGAGGATNLEYILDCFKDWSSNQE